MTPSWRGAGALVAVATVLSACGDGPSMAEVLADDLRASEAFADVALTEEEAECAADAVVDDLGEDRLVELGLGDDGDPAADFTAIPQRTLAVLASSVDRCVPDLDDVLTVALTDGIVDEPDETLPVTETEATCVAEALVTGFGAERLLVLGAVTGDGDPFSSGAIDADETVIVADSFLGCLDIRSVFRAQFVADGVPEETAGCLAREIPDENLQQLFAAQFAGEPVDPDELIGPALETCGLG